MLSAIPQLDAPKRPHPQVRAPRPAGFFSRAEAFVIDLVIISVVQLVGSVMAEKIFNILLITRLSDAVRTFLENVAFKLAASSVIIVLFVIGYFAFFWTLVGFTPGKAVLGLKVVRKDGSRVTFGRALLRVFAYWISAIPFFLGFFWVLWDPDRRCWHDKIAGTQVLFIPKNPPS